MSKYSQELREQVMKEAKQTGNATMVARRHQIPAATVHSWLQGPKVDVESANAKSRKLQKELEESRLENDILKELLKKTNQAWLKE